MMIQRENQNPTPSEMLSDLNKKHSSVTECIVECNDKITEPMKEFYASLIKFQGSFKGLTYDKTAKASEYSKYDYVSHHQLVKEIAKPLAECDLGYTSRAMKVGDILTVNVTLFHKNGYSEKSVMEFLLPNEIFAQGVRNNCCKTKKADGMNPGQYLKEMAKAESLALKYNLMNMLGIAGGETSDSEEEKAKPSNKPDYKAKTANLKARGKEMKLCTDQEMEEIIRFEPNDEEKYKKLRAFLREKKDMAQAESHAPKPSTGQDS